MVWTVGPERAVGAIWTVGHLGLERLVGRVGLERMVGTERTVR
jgi:hypothetical protein